MSEKEKKFRSLLKEFGVTKCYVSKGFNFDATEPDGSILVDVNNNKLIMSIYKLFTKDPDGIIGDSQILWVTYSNFVSDKENYDLEVIA